MDLGRGQAGSAGESEGGTEGRGLGRAEHAADQVLACVGDEPAYAHALVGQAVPDGEQQAGDQPEAGLRVGRQPGDLGLPEGAPAVLIGIPPLRGVERVPGHGVAGSRADQADALLHPAVVEHAGRCGPHQGGSLRLAIHHEPGLVAGDLGMKLERRGGGKRLQPVAAQDLGELGLGAGGLVDEHRLARAGGERVGGDGLDAPLEGAGLDGVFDIGLDAGLKRGEQRVLLGNRECQQPVEKLSASAAGPP